MELSSCFGNGFSVFGTLDHLQELWGTPPLRSTAPLLTVILCQRSHLQFVATLSFRLPSFAKHFQKDLFLQFHQRWHTKEQLRSCIVTTCDALVWEPVWSLPYKMGLPLFSLWLWVVFATLTHFDHLAWSNSVRCDAPFTMMALRTHIGTCSIYLSANGKSKEPLCLGSMCRASRCYNWICRRENTDALE